MLFRKSWSFTSCYAHHVHTDFWEDRGVCQGRTEVVDTIFSIRKQQLGVLDILQIEQRPPVLVLQIYQLIEPIYLI